MGVTELLGLALENLYLYTLSILLCSSFALFVCLIDLAFKYGILLCNAVCLRTHYMAEGHLHPISTLWILGFVS